MQIYYRPSILVIFLLEVCLAQEVILNNQTTNLTVYSFSNESYNPQFGLSRELCCTPEKLYAINATGIVIFLEGNGKIESYSMKFDGHDVLTDTRFIGNTIQVNFTCEDKGKGAKGSGLAKNSLSIQDDEGNIKNLKFDFWYRCGVNKFTPITFDWSNLVLIIITCIMILVMARFSKILCIRIPVTTSNKWIVGSDQQIPDSQLAFQGIRVTYWFMLIYLIGAVLYYLLILIVGNKRSFDFNLGITSSVALLLGMFCLNEIMCSLSANFRLQTKIYGGVRVCDLLSVVFASSLVAIYVLTGQPWIMSDILSLLMVGSCLKLAKVTSFKDGTIFLILCMIYDAAFYIFVNISLNTNYQQYILKYANFPTLLEIPTIVDSYQVKCSWLSIEDIILPGFLICYLYRYDTNKNSMVYTIIGVSSFIVGLVIWIICSVSGSYVQVTFPQSMFVFTFVIGATLLWATKQGDFKSLWSGHFYDKAILQPILDNDSNQGSMLQETELDPKIFRGLNNSLAEM